MGNKEKDRIIRIFETAIHYNLIIKKYSHQIEALDYLVDLIFLCEYKNKRSVLKTIRNYLLEKEPTATSLLYDELQNKVKNNFILSLATYLKSYLTVALPLDFLLKEKRLKYSPKILLKKYLELHKVTEGFNAFDNEMLNSFFTEFSELECIRDNNLFLRSKVSIRLNKERGFVYIYYDEKTTSFRQSLYYALLLEKNVDFLKTYNNTYTLNQYANILTTLAYYEETKTSNIGKSKFLKNIVIKYPRETFTGFADIRVIERGGKYINGIIKNINAHYELNENDKERENEHLSERTSSDLTNTVPPDVQVKSALSTFINYYSFILSHMSFFKELKRLRQSLEADLSCSHDNSPPKYILQVALNSISSNPTYESKDELGILFNTLRIKYKNEIASLKEQFVTDKFWGYFFDSMFIPQIFSLIETCAFLRKNHGDDLASLTHTVLDSSGISTKFKNARIINHILPNMTNMAIAGYGLGNPATVMPMTNNHDIVSNISAALQFFDRNALQGFLTEITINGKLKKIEEIIWGLFYYYERNWNEKKLSDNSCIDIISDLYDAPISESRFLSGKQTAKNIIESFKKMPT